MRTIRWTPLARSSYLRFLRELKAVSPPAAARAQSAVETMAARLALNPALGRSSRRWPAYREWSLTAQHKLLVYEGDDRVLHIIAFYDMRQDLSVVSPKPNDGH